MKMIYRHILTREDVEYARQYDDGVMQSFGGEDDNYTGLAAENRFYTGALGERGFKTILDVFGKRYTHNPTSDGTPDRADFFAFSRGSRLWIDVKTATHSHHKFLMIPEVQFQRPDRRVDLYVGARLNGNVVELHGWIWAGLFAEHSQVQNVKIPTRLMPLADLRPIESLLDELDEEGNE